jgi:hypothetical protein
MIAGRRRITRLIGQFAPKPVDLLRSHAFRVLSQSGHRVLARIEIELADHGGKENGKLPVTYTDFVDYGIDRHAISPAIDEVEALGLVQVTERGQSGNSEFRRPSLFRLTYRNTDKAPPTDEWRAVETREQALCVVLAARKMSIGRSRRKREQRDAEPLKASG